MKECGKMAMWGVVLALAIALLLPGVAAAKRSPGEVFTCVPDEKLEKTVAAEAGLEEFSCEFKKYEGYETLHFKIGIKNVTDKDQRYRVNIFLSNGKAAGGLIPTKGNLKAGESATFVYPILQMESEPDAVVLNIRTISE